MSGNVQGAAFTKSSRTPPERRSTLVRALDLFTFGNRRQSELPPAQTISEHAVNVRRGLRRPWIAASSFWLVVRPAMAVDFVTGHL
jgi:hypothetical protein